MNKCCNTCGLHRANANKDRCKIHGIINTSVFPIAKLGTKCPSYIKLIKSKV